MLFELRDVFVSDRGSKSVEHSLDLSKTELNGSYPFKTPVLVFAKAENRAGLVKLIIDVEYTYFAPCDRCGMDLKRKYKQRFEHNVVASLSSDSDEEYIEIPDYELELDDLVMADIFLELPSKFLCRKDCKGLCSICGKNLNEGECSCKKNLTDPRLEVLKQLLDPKKS